MEQAKIDRINALAHKAKSPAGVTPEEQAERDALRLEYVAAYRKNLEAQLNNLTVVTPDGKKHRVRRKDAAEQNEQEGISNEK